MNFQEKQIMHVYEPINTEEDRERDHFVIQFFDGFKDYDTSIIIHLLEHIEEYRSSFPAIQQLSELISDYRKELLPSVIESLTGKRTLTELSINEVQLVNERLDKLQYSCLYQIFDYVSLDQFLQFFFNKEGSILELKSEIEYAMRFDHTPNLLFEKTIARGVQMGLINRIDFFESHITPGMVAELESQFGSTFDSHVFFGEGTLHDALEYFPNATSVVVRYSEELLQIAQSKECELLRNKKLYIPYTRYNSSQDKEELIKHLTLFKTLLPKVNATPFAIIRKGDELVKKKSKEE